MLDGLKMESSVSVPKETNTTLCLVALINPSLEGNFNHQGQIPTHAKELAVMFLSIIENILSGFVVAGKQFNQSNGTGFSEYFNELFLNALNV